MKHSGEIAQLYKDILAILINSNIFNGQIRHTLRWVNDKIRLCALWLDWKIIQGIYCDCVPDFLKCSLAISHCSPTKHLTQWCNFNSHSTIWAWLQYFVSSSLCFASRDTRTFRPFLLSFSFLFLRWQLHWSTRLLGVGGDRMFQPILMAFERHGRRGMKWFFFFTWGGGVEGMSFVTAVSYSGCYISY